LSFNDMNKVTLALNRLHRLEKLYEQHKQPDPITGLVPCGCGGKAVEVGCKNASEWTYECNACGVKTKSQPNNAWAKQDWNTAMGWKE
jgi:hypothetical protein